MLKLAHEFKRADYEQFGNELTHREYRTWLAYFESKWDTPDATQQYLMLLGLEIRRIRKILALDNSPTEFKDLQLDFSNSQDEQRTDETVEEYSARQESAWLGALGTTRKQAQSNG